jgi:hypothetical protein
MTRITSLARAIRFTLYVSSGFPTCFFFYSASQNGVRLASVCIATKVTGDDAHRDAFSSSAYPDS